MSAKVASLPLITADAELLILPYASVQGASLLQRLIAELGTGAWSSFRCASAFGKASGNIPDLLTAMDTFLESGGHISMTFGADTFAGATKGTDLLAVSELLEQLSKHTGFCLHLYHETGRTFHPKLYFFDNGEHGLLIIGSSNWSEGGMFDNVEANVVLSLDYASPGHQLYREAVCELIDEYWGES